MEHTNLVVQINFAGYPDAVLWHAKGGAIQRVNEGPDISGLPKSVKLLRQCTYLLLYRGKSLQRIILIQILDPPKLATVISECYIE
jgi:hypothetical protein